MGPRRCVKCGSVPKISRDSNYTYIECCHEYYDNDENKTLIEWNEINKLYYHLFGIRYTLTSDEKVERELDCFMTFDDDDRDEINAVLMLRKIWSDSPLDCLLSSRRLNLLNNISGVIRRSSVEQMGLYIFTLQKRLDRSSVEDIIKNLPKSELDKMKIRKTGKEIFKDVL